MRRKTKEALFACFTVFAGWCITGNATQINLQSANQNNHAVNTSVKSKGFSPAGIQDASGAQVSVQVTKGDKLIYEKLPSEDDPCGWNSHSCAEQQYFTEMKEVFLKKPYKAASYMNMYRQAPEGEHTKIAAAANRLAEAFIREGEIEPLLSLHYRFTRGDKTGGYKTSFGSGWKGVPLILKNAKLTLKERNLFLKNAKSIQKQIKHLKTSPDRSLFGAADHVARAEASMVDDLAAFIRQVPPAVTAQAKEILPAAAGEVDNRKGKPARKQGAAEWKFPSGGNFPFHWPPSGFGR